MPPECSFKRILMDFGFGKVAGSDHKCSATRCYRGITLMGFFFRISDYFFFFYRIIPEILLEGGIGIVELAPAGRASPRGAPLRSAPVPSPPQTYRSCWRSVRRRTRCPCGTSSSRTCPRRSPRCTAPAACRSGWNCWTWCRTTAWWWPGRCRKAWPLYASPRTSSWWWEPTRQGTGRQSSRWEPEMLSAAGLSPWQRTEEIGFNPSPWMTRDFGDSSFLLRSS